MPNNVDDIQTITDLLDHISVSNGGTQEIRGGWSNDRNALIAEVAAAITAFQTANARPVIDGVVDPQGGTLALLNRIAGPLPVKAVLTRDEVNSQFWLVADPLSLDGTDDLQPMPISPTLRRSLIRVGGSSIKWFGVVVPLDASNGIIGGSPHIFFTPSPWQGGYYDPGYEAFDSWMNLWDKYTSIIGSQLVASNAPQVLVIPFYKNSQTGNLGAFLTNWREVISAVVTAAVNTIDPLFLRNTFTVTDIFTSSFSNGIASHQNFNGGGVDVATSTRRAFDLDGQASGSRWRPTGGVVYSNILIDPALDNPAGLQWRVGRRFGLFHPSYLGTSDHNLCPFLLMHGLRFFGR